jgi:hypothetical protein
MTGMMAACMMMDKLYDTAQMRREVLVCVGHEKSRQSLTGG